MSNLVTRVGNVTVDPEMRFTKSGKSVASFSLAYEPYNPETKERGETVFYNCAAWGKMAENVIASVHKGDRIIVVGMPSVREYESNGEKRQSKEISVTAMGPELRFATAVVTKNPRANTASADPWAGDESAF